MSRMDYPPLKICPAYAMIISLFDFIGNFGVKYAAVFIFSEVDSFMVVTVLSIIQVIACLFLIVTILLQKAPSQGMSGAIGGGQETFFGSNKATGIEAVLANLTKIFAIVFVVDSLFLVLLG